MKLTQATFSTSEGQATIFLDEHGRISAATGPQVSEGTVQMCYAKFRELKQAMKPDVREDLDEAMKDDEEFYYNEGLGQYLVDSGELEELCETGSLTIQGPKGKCYVLTLRAAEEA